MDLKALTASTVEAIGRTPLVELSRLTRDLDGRILTKLDYLYSQQFSKDARHATLNVLLPLPKKLAFS